MAKREADAGPRVSKILIVDDHPIVREGLSLLLSTQPDLEVCGEAADASTALQLVAETSPDLVIVDISLKGGNGIDLIKRIKARDPAARMLVSSMYDESLYAERALRAGASGYINKQEATRKITDAIRAVLDGKIFLSERMAGQMLQRAVGGRSGRIEHSPLEDLSDRELEVFELIGRGRSTREIAEALHLSAKTVETYRDRVRKKLDLNDCSELTRHAIVWVLQGK